MKKYPYFRVYPADFTSDGAVESMTTEQVGAYWLLLCKAWHEDPCGTVPDDDRVLARWSRLSLATWKRNKEAILKPFRLHSDNRFHQKRMKSENERLQDYSKRQAEKAQNRWEKGKDGDAVALPGHNSGIAEAMPPIVISKLKENTPLPSGGPPAPRVKREPFVPPSLEEVRTYAAEKRLEFVDPAEFHGYWTIEEWRNSKGRRFDWRKAMLQRERVLKERGGTTRPSRVMNPDVLVGKGESSAPDVEGAAKLREILSTRKERGKTREEAEREWCEWDAARKRIKAAG